MTNTTFEGWKAEAVAYAQDVTKEQDVSWLIGCDEAMRGLGFDFGDTPEEYVQRMYSRRCNISTHHLQ